MFTLHLISPWQCGSFSEEGERKEPSVCSQALLSPNPTPSHLQTGPPDSCSLAALFPAPPRRGRYLETRSPPGLSGRPRLALLRVTTAVCERKRVGSAPGKTPTRVPTPASEPWEPRPISSHLGSLTTFPGSPPKIVNAVIRGRLVSRAGSDSEQRPGVCRTWAAWAEWWKTRREDALANSDPEEAPRVPYSSPFSPQHRSLRCGGSLTGDAPSPAGR